jgi:hypothetical protein
MHQLLFIITQSSSLSYERRKKNERLMDKSKDIAPNQCLRAIDEQGG